jgi:apolipoprotein N-acyltransferase
MQAEKFFTWLDGAGRWLRAQSSARRFALAFGFGICGALSFPPFLIFPLLLLSYAGLLLLLSDVQSAGYSARRNFPAAAALGWAYGFGFFLVGLHWIGFAFLVNSKEHLWLLPFAAILMPGGLALFFAVAAGLVALAKRRGPQSVFVFALAFGAVEFIRGHIFTGFPWNLPAYGWGASTAMLQSAAFFGAYGLSVLTLILGGSLALLVADSKGRRHAGVPVVVALFFLGLWANGALRLAFSDNETVPGVRLRIVQPATPQTEKYVPEHVARNWRRLTDLTQTPSPVQPTHVIWPEAAPPFLLLREPEAMAELARTMRPYRALLTGAVRVEPADPRPVYFNSFFIFDSTARLLATYDKFHLVPFGEYMPFEETMKKWGITQIAGGPAGFGSGDGPRAYAVPGAPLVGPLICYEIIFPGAVTGDMRPQWLLSVTDDSWFGPNAGPMQHLLIARVRAIEEGLPVARAANSGISAIIDSYGRVRGRLDLGLRGVLDGDLPVALATPPYVRFGETIFLLLLVLCAAAAWWPAMRHKA